MLTIDKYTAVDLEEYKDTFSIVEGYVSRDGDFKPSWCKREFGKMEARIERTIPVKVKLGTRAKVIEVALWLLKDITGHDYSPVSYTGIAQQIPEEEIPF